MRTVVQTEADSLAPAGFCLHRKLQCCFYFWRKKLLELKMNLNLDSDADDKQLNRNLQKLNIELCNLIDDEEDWPPIIGTWQPVVSDARGVLHEVNRKFEDLILDENAPEFEFHGYGCTQAMNAIPKRFTNAANSGAKKKTNNTAHATQQNTREQQQKENVWNTNQEFPGVLTYHELGNR